MGGLALSDIVSPEMFRRSKERRCETRVSVALPATAAISGKDYTVRVVNVTPSGAMFATSAPLADRSRFIFKCGAIAVRATVAWVSGSYTGVMFDRELSNGEVAEQLSRSSAVAARQQLTREQRRDDRSSSSG
jgi:hypothetical protein